MKRNSEQSGVEFGKYSANRVARPGPLVHDFDGYDSSMNKLTLFQMLSSTRTVRGTNDFKFRFVTYGTNGLTGAGVRAGAATSRDLVMSKLVTVHPSRGNMSTSEMVMWRTSTACIQNRVEVSYSADPTCNSTAFKWGIFSTKEDVTRAMRFKYTGSRETDGAQQHFNASEQGMQLGALVDQYDMIKGTRCQSTHFWYRVFYNLCQIRLTEHHGAGQNGRNFHEGVNRTTWNLRPLNPLFCECNINGINTYLQHAGGIMSGNRVVIEVSVTELPYLPYINFLIGAGPETFSYRFPDVADARLLPHLQGKRPVGMVYGYLVYVSLSAQNAISLVSVSNMALPGLDEYEAVAGQEVLDFDEDILNTALLILARTVPMPEDMEAGALLLLIGCFAENFNGVDNESVIGKDENHKNYCALLHEGRVPVPGGSLACCAFARLDGRKVLVKIAKERLVDIMRSFRDVGAMRNAVQVYTLAMQMGCRQYSLDVGTMFSLVDPAELYNQAVVNLPTHCSSAAVISEAHGHTESEPPGVGIMTSLMCKAMYGCVLSQSSLYIKVGNMSEAAKAPRNDYNIGECLSGVHAAQLDSGVLLKQCEGLTGMPYGLGKLASEMSLHFAGFSGVEVNGESACSVESQRVDLVPGINMLGHASSLMLDMHGRNGDFSVLVAPMRSGILVGVKSMVRLALSQASAFKMDRWTSAYDIKYRLPPLFCDFDPRVMADLTLSADMHVAASYWNNPTDRYRVPGFVEAFITQGLREQMRVVRATEEELLHKHQKEEELKVLQEQWRVLLKNKTMALYCGREHAVNHDACFTHPEIAMVAQPKSSAVNVLKKRVGL
jgi:hypothetical protein